MIGHMARGQDGNLVFPGKNTVEGEVNQMVTKIVKEHPAIGRPLIAVVKDIVCKLPAFHGDWNLNITLCEVRNHHVKKQKSNV